MKFLKTYEELKEYPTQVKLGDYILLQTFTPMDEYLDHTIGQVHWVSGNEVGVKFPPVEPIGMRFSFTLFKIYHDTKDQCDYAYRKFKMADIIYSSENKEDLEQIISANKYNI